MTPSYTSRCLSSLRAMAVTLLLICSVHMGTISPAHAQQKTPSEEQASLYQRAQVAYEEGDYEATIALLETANKIQPFDLFTYNIARAHFRLRHCEAARQSYEQARIQPSLGPNLLTQIRDGLEELKNVCPGTLALTCVTPEQTSLSIDRGEPSPCSTFTPVELKPGAHTLTVSLDDQTDVIPFEITGMETTTLSVELRPITRPLTFASTTWGKRLTITGGVLFGGALLLDQTLVRSRNNAYVAANQSSLQTTDILERKQKLRRSQALVLGMGTLGILSLSAGLPLWIRGNISDKQVELGLHMQF